MVTFFNLIVLISYPINHFICHCPVIFAVLFHNLALLCQISTFQTENPSVIQFDGKDYTFEGFSLFSHQPLKDVSFPVVTNFTIKIVDDTHRFV